MVEIKSQVKSTALWDTLLNTVTGWNSEQNTNKLLKKKKLFSGIDGSIKNL